MAVTTNSLAMDTASLPATPTDTSATASIKSCCPMANVWAWTKEKAAATQTIIAPKLEVAKQFVANHKQAVIIASAVAAVVVTAAVIYRIAKKHTAKKTTQKTRLQFDVVR